MKAAMPMLRKEKDGGEQLRKPEGYVAAGESNRQVDGEEEKFLWSRLG